MAYPITPLPDDELALIQYLRTRSEVTALVPAASITTQLAPSPTYPVVLITRVGGVVSSAPWRLDISSIQVDVVGPIDRATCKALTQTVRAAVVAIANDTVTAATLVSATEEIAPQWLPDTVSNPPMPRFVSRFRVVLHS